MAYHFTETDYGKVYYEVFEANQWDCDEWNEAEGLSEDNGDTLYTPGYYFAYGQPGCLYDSAPYGPYEKYEEAIVAAEENF
jgi:hypothetical protein